jgi:hypothetical protein
MSTDGDLMTAADHINLDFARQDADRALELAARNLDELADRSH